MTPQPPLKPCPVCKTFLAPDLQRCPRCGAGLSAVRSEPGSQSPVVDIQAVDRTTASSEPSTRNEGLRIVISPKAKDWLFWISAGLLALIAIGLVGLIWYDHWQQANAADLELTISPDNLPRALNQSGAPSVQPDPAVVAALTAQPTLTPVQVDPAQLSTVIATPDGEELDPNPAPANTSSQIRTATEIRDDFSTNLLGWSEAEREDSRRGYLPEGQYYIEVDAPGVFALSFLPVDFAPELVEFQAQVPEAAPGGTFGVLCQFSDENNFYLVEIDPASGTLALGQRKDGLYTALTDPEWQDAVGLVTVANAANQINVTCSDSEILVSINGQVAGRRGISTPLPQGSQMAIFAAGYEGILATGFQVLIDNLFARAAGPGEFR